jgi:SAM-dependent methyltransferase
MTSAKPAAIDEPGACSDGWTDRLSLIEEWYQDLVGDGYEVAEAEIDRWIRPHREYLSRLKGKVIDVGGGIGTIGRFLSPECQHVVVDPAGLWNRREWREFGQRFAPERSPTFVEARGEDLPFADGSFDAAVSCCSLNHVDLPEPCIAELARIVRPEGRVLLVLEDMEPTWPDVLIGAARQFAWRLGLASERPPLWHASSVGGVMHSAARKLSGRAWPVQPDHICIEERKLRRWLAPWFRITHRSWRGTLLTFELERLNSPQKDSSDS